MYMGANKLCLLWQNQESRNWYHIGNLLYDQQKYYFEYQTEPTKRNVYDALKNGYRIHPTFPDLDEKYESSVLFSAFARRLPSLNRKDYQVILRNLGITNATNEFEIMSITGGASHSDNYEFLKPIESDGENFKLDFYLRGWRHYNEESESLLENDVLTLVRESDNEYDSDAVAVYKNEDKKIGYVPAFYSQFISQMIESYEDNVRYDLEHKFDPEAPSHFKVEMNIKGLDNSRVLQSYFESTVVEMDN